jgi:hypothetical protein
MATDWYPHVISSRLTKAEGTLLESLKDTLPEGTWSAAIRWILNDPTCVERIREQGQDPVERLQRAQWWDRLPDHLRVRAVAAAEAAKNWGSEPVDQHVDVVLGEGVEQEP